MSSVVIDKQLILRAQQLDLIYYQSGILYETIPHVVRPSTDPSKPPIAHHGDGVVGSTS